ncbi:MAG: type 1 glutamine amidotransferase domain-containing protein [Pseudomonadota bacterium]
MIKANKRNVLMLVSNTGVSPVTSWPVGFWWAELSHAWLEFTNAGYNVTIASPNGGAVEADVWSDPEHDAGYAANDIVSQGFKTLPRTSELLRNTPALAALDMDQFDAVFIVGGQGPMVTMIEDDALHACIARHFEAERILAAVCHGTCVLLKIRLLNGDLLVNGRTWTGFANSEEQYAEAAAGTKIQPFWIETEARKIEGTNFVTAGPLATFAVRDGNLITGQQQNSSGAAAKLVVAAVGS